MSEVKLTKKQKKASAFRSTKGKGKKVDGEPLDVPENDLNEDGEEEEGEGTIKAPKDKSKKRKIERVEDGDDATKEGGEGGEEGADGEEPKKKKRQRGKKPGARMEAGNSRLILFVGNLPFKVTIEQIQEHFSACGEKPTIRLLTPKPKPSTSPADATSSRTKGCAFLQFTLATALQSALRLHNSEMGGRKINVELSAGGGGNSEVRKAKIGENRKRLELEREKAAKHKKEREGVTEEEEVVKDKSARWGPKKEVPAPVAPAAEGGEGKAPGKKVRDRRIPKLNVMGEEKERKRAQEARVRARPSGANSMPLGSY